jgi:hypothetical protein
MDVLVLDWKLSERFSMEIKADGEAPVLLNERHNGFASSPLYYKLPESLKPGQKVRLDIDFKQSFEFSEDQTEFGLTAWYPRLWWDGLPLHDAFSVQLDIPEGFALAISGRLNEATDRYEIDGAKTFGFYMGKEQKTVTQEVEGVRVTTLSTARGALCAEVCMKTALDAIKYYKEWLGFYPHDFFYIIPGGSGRWGGYPFATGIVVIHSKGYSIISALDVVLGRETFEDIYRKCLNTFGGKRLGWREFQRFCENETGQNQNWKPADSISLHPTHGWGI